MTYVLFVQVRYPFQYLSVDILRVVFTMYSRLCNFIKNFLAFNILHHLVNFILEPIVENFHSFDYVKMSERQKYFKFFLMSYYFFLVVVPYDLDRKNLIRMILVLIELSSEQRRTFICWSWSNTFVTFVNRGVLTFSKFVSNNVNIVKWMHFRLFKFFGQLYASLFD